MASNIRVKTEKFRAINDADIIIDGITLVAGENGCGKSTISKLLYFLFKTVSNYDIVVKQKLNNSLRDVLRFLEIFQQEIVYSQSDRKIRDEYRKEIEELRRSLFYSDFLLEESEKWIALIDKVEYLYSNYSKKEDENLFRNSNSVGSRINRLNRIIKEILREDYNVEDYRQAFSNVKQLVIDKFKEAKGKIDSRPTSIFTEELAKVFTDSKLPKKFDVFEYEDIIVSLEKSNLSIPFSIDQAIYIDTPMMLSIEQSHNEYWDDLNELLLDDSSKNENPISEIISKEIIKGDVEYEDGIFVTDEFKFKREDGSVFNLLDVATGIKSFSILQLLLKNGHLNNKTLMIIDEPESHLHPQWIIEYARIIVLLNKYFGVKFFLASHNPDMVQAIRYISEKENILDDVNFYLAKKEEGKYVYNYEFLQKEIDPIFESFNIALDRINKYGI
ncbi:MULTISPECIES: AAA family ATPase [Empedobacter]|uniref:AAA family ATPase n=1 Tax=Empedobacter TaxID=59734 RepID=UPI002575B420|nr:MULTISPECIES: AAA family ATPase [Empedobacter]MDM1043190.1 ATP-binding protein [Empedobacter brevis]MDM1137117.1 ATP-binding protein [Empedobacter sp. R750]